MTTEVFITRSAAYLPGEAVSNDEMESVLGMVRGKPSRVRRLILRNNGITSRHYALDRTSGEPVMTHAQLTASAIRGLGETGTIDCLATGTSIPDQILPSHGVMVHGELGWPQLEVVSLAGICLSGTAALKYAFMAVATGSAKKAVATGSELVSPLMHARHFNTESEHKIASLEAHPEIAFEKDFLRWMLSDGAGALPLPAGPARAESVHQPRRRRRRRPQRRAHPCRLPALAEHRLPAGLRRVRRVRLGARAGRARAGTAARPRPPRARFRAPQPAPLHRSMARATH